MPDKVKVALVGPAANDEGARKRVVQFAAEAGIEVELVDLDGPDVKTLWLGEDRMEQMSDKLQFIIRAHKCRYPDMPKRVKDRSEYKSKKDRRNHWR